jgi:hypothetical protein
MVCAVWGGRKRGKKARCFRVQPAEAAASVGGGERGRGVGRQPLPLWRPFSLSWLQHDTTAILIKTKITIKEKHEKNAPSCFLESRQQVDVYSLLHDGYPVSDNFFHLKYIHVVRS